MRLSGALDMRLCDRGQNRLSIIDHASHHLTALPPRHTDADKGQAGQAGGVSYGSARM